MAEQEAERYLDQLLARCSFPAAGAAVTCAVSGGADSLALLALAVRAGCDVTAVHVDHGIRPGSHAEATVVAEAAQRLGARFRSERVRVEPGPDLEARARAARYAALPSGVLTGHTADDQAETVLLNLMRGAGTDGLAGFRPDQRPIRALRRRETVELCDRLQLEPVSDPSNEDARFRRNRVRHELIPLLDDIAQRDVSPLIARSAEVLRADAELLDQLSQALDPTDARAVAEAPLPLARRAIRGWLRDGPEQHPPDAATVERVLAVARGEVIACEVGAGRRVSRSGQRLSLG